MRLPENVTVYIAGKKYVRNIPDELAPEGIKPERSDTKPLKRIVKESEKDSK